MRTILRGFVLVAALGWSGLATADVIHLQNGSHLEVDAWRDAGDAIEFASGGGVVRIAKSEVRKIDGKAHRGEFKMYSSGTASAGEAAGPTGGPEKSAATKRMADLLREGDALFAPSALTANEKAGAFRRLGERWREFEVPETLREAHARGQQALQLASEAFAAEGATPGDPSPEARRRLLQAQSQLRGAQEEVRKAEEAAAKKPGSSG
jgi:hypothetical protein